VQNGGSDSLNGGGFDPGNGNFATDLTATSGNTSSPVVSSASYTFASGDVGAWLFVQSGTNWIPGWYPIASVSGGSATLTASIGSACLYGGSTYLSTAAGCASTASPSSGVWGVDYSRSASARTSYTDMVIGSTTTQFTSAGNPVGKNLVGNCVQITSGTGFTTQIVQVSSTSGTTATCDKSLGTASSTGGNGGLGGAFASPGFAMTQINSQSANQNVMWIKYSASVYALSNTANGSGGKLTQTVGGTSQQHHMRILGYNTIRGDFAGNRPILSGATNSMKLIEIGPSGGGGQLDIDFLEFRVSGGATGVIGVYNTNGGGNVYCRRLYGNGVGTTINFNSSGSHNIISCAASANTGTSFTANGSSSSYWYGCAAYNGSGAGFIGGTQAFIHRSVAYAMSNQPGFSTLWNGVYGCVSYGNTSSNGYGFESTCPHYNCAAYGNAQAGFTNSGAGGGTLLVNCAGGGNSGGNYAASDFPVAWNTGFISLSADPFTSASTLDFSLNNTAGGGSSLRAAGFNPAPQGLLSTDYLDVGAFQHQSAGGGAYPRSRVVGGS
jgi:hypothetical protein